MQHTNDEAIGLRGFSRPRYFYGQLLDVRHFQSEQDYLKKKVWMLNRLVSGYGVVCGLDVQVGEDHHSVQVMPGLALDKGGREIVVPCRSKKVPVESAPPREAAAAAKPDAKAEQGQHCAADWVHLIICFAEHPTDPEPVFSGGCDSTEQCSAGAIREGYELRIVEGKAPEISLDCQIPNLIRGNALNYRALADWVSAPCDQHDDLCIVLANIRRPQAGDELQPNDIDISARPVVYSLDLLWELVLALTHETQGRRIGKN